MPHELGMPVQEVGAAGAAVTPAVAEAKVENFFDNFVEPQCGHFVPSQLLERTRISLSVSHFPQ
jgi:ABC-type transporter lipoprotein component MlaA